MCKYESCMLMLLLGNFLICHSRVKPLTIRRDMSVSETWDIFSCPWMRTGVHSDGYSIILTQCVLWASHQIRKIAGCACARNAGDVFPAADFKGNRQLAIPACITARAVLHVGIANPRWQGKHSRHSRGMHNPQFHVSGKRPILGMWHKKSFGAMVQCTKGNCWCIYW